jgi:hypothetical protein
MRWTCVAAMAAVILGGMIFAPGVSAADPLWAYTHPEAKILIGVDWQRAKASPTGQMLRRQLLEMTGALPGPAKGLGFIDSVERILISAPGELSGNTAESPVLVALQGRLDQAALRSSMVPGTAVERYRGADLLIPPRGEGQDVIAAVVNDSLTLLGDRASIELALTDLKGLRDATLRDRAGQMAYNCEIWMIAAVPPMKPGTAAEANPMAAGFDSIQAMDFGLSLSNGLGLKMNMEFADAASAQNMAMGVQMLNSMLMSNKSASPEMAKVARSLQVEQVGPRLRFNVDIPMDVLEKGILQAKAGFEEAAPKSLEGLLGMKPASGPVPGMRPSVTRAPEPAWPKEPVKRTIRIVGLDEGEREINYTVGGRRP